jgi:hypothetical protein
VRDAISNREIEVILRVNANNEIHKIKKKTPIGEERKKKRDGWFTK